MSGTGYTYPVLNGEVTNFPDFALNCARAFGALVTLRDEPTDAPIPDQFEPSSYHKEALEGQELLLAELRKMDATQMAQHRDTDEMLRQQQREERIKESIEATERLNQMIAEVENWEPPTSDHIRLQVFMLDQLRMSDARFYDYDKDPLPDAQTYHASRIKEAEDKLEYHRKAYAEEVERTNQRNQWLQQLRESLK